MDITYQDLIQIGIFIVRHLLFGVGRVFLAFPFFIYSRAYCKNRRVELMSIKTRIKVFM